ncbi:maleylacetoacetate isomerase [Halomonas sp. I5-271120]|uniref:maleylacetoacetate isomerase n=1 Tax=Halomonas sp. I5-271120 TaxID=3061632 RepID=UPI0027147516|nr:maleylacetoacetate isomerase [Halomonas sp. I5-271120]
MMTLYGYYRSSAAYRVRIALNLKGLDIAQVPVDLAGGAQREESFRAINPQGLVPVLETDDGERLTQSLAICEYLDERYPSSPALLPEDAAGRARVRGLAQLIANEIHPLNNLRVLRYLIGDLELDEDAKLGWYRHWVAEGFTALEAMLENDQTGRCCHGDTPTLADICLVPQVYNAERFDCDLSAYPRLRAVAEYCRGLPAFEQASPSRQPDAR